MRTRFPPRRRVPRISSVAASDDGKSSSDCQSRMAERGNAGPGANRTVASQRIGGGPFCLLDEVDAPLDDANIGRFVRMLNEFKKKTQFIVITHNPRTTTEAADAVYGITMQEPGVSSVVSVRMRGAPLTDIVTDDAEDQEGAEEADATVERTVEVRPVSEAVPAPL